MKVIRNLFIASSVLICSLEAMAVPAKRISFTTTQPDGTTVTLTRGGDEFNKFFTADDGAVVVASTDGAYYFAAVDQATGRMVPSATLAANAASRTPLQKQYVASMSRLNLGDAMKVNASKSRIAPRKDSRSLAPSRAQASYPQQGIGLFPGATYPRTGSPKGLIILVEYSDVKFDLGSKAKTYFNDLVKKKGFSEYGATGCAEEYFEDNSMGKFTPDFEVYGPVTLPNKRAYYGQNDYYGNDVNPEQMIIDGCKLLDSQINFKDFDTDGDGYVDNVFVFYAGEGEASSDVDEAVWPHQWELESGYKSLTLDGVRINRYACSNETYDGVPEGIGTFVHEFSHVMGLPDLYHTSDNSAYYTPGEWSVLDYGPYNNNGRTPPAYSIFERNAMGWADITVLDRNPASLELEHIMTSNQGFLIPTDKDTEFFLLENRQQNGWDKFIPGHGMLIWHIDYNANTWLNNEVNNTKSHQYVDIEEANNNPNSMNPTTSAEWAFPGSRGLYTSFTDNTTPSMLTWSRKSLNMPITNIAETNGLITFDLCGGAPDILPPVAELPSEIGNGYFEATWQPAEGAVDYLLSVYAKSDDVAMTDTNDFGDGSAAKNPEGWETATTSVYTSDGNFGEASPSYKLAKKGEYFSTPYYPGAIDKVTFWAKGMNQTSNTLSVYSVDENNNETLIATLSDWNLSKGEIVTFEPKVKANKLKFVFNKENTGNLAIDDIVVSYSGAGAKVLDNYNAVSTGGATSMRVDNLPNDAIDFQYSVVAVNANGQKSAASNLIDVKLTSSVTNLPIDNADQPVEYFNLQGQRVTTPKTGQLYIRRQGTTATKVIF
ncbi:MAG: M6 family metalloprotease domain-containing protein [Muribaculaceae bacterium]|nr:M6 family metalloprotease domain-containing protein [Muribaculaceae bacterium]